MNSVFNFEDYVVFLRAYITSQPKNGRGLIQKLALSLGVNPTFISQVLSGLKNFSTEQGFEVCEFLGLTGIEKDYFVLLIQKKKAGSQKAENYFQGKAQELSDKALKLSHRISSDKTLTETQRAIFYSSWLYSSIRLFISLNPIGKTLEEIVEEFNLSRSRSTEILSFLVESGLCKQDGVYYKIGAQSTHLDNKSPFIIRHHMNWRNRALQRHENIRENELVYSAPMSLSEKDFTLLREQLVQWIKSMANVVKESPSEKMAFLNIDFLYINDKQ